MLVYGDHSERLSPRARLVELSRELQGKWLSHDALTRIFIDLAGIAQGVADSDFQRSGVDRVRPDERFLLEQLVEVAGLLWRSWREGRSGAPGRTLRVPELSPDEIEVRIPEGYAFYALRPESYAAAATKLELLGKPRIIGLRSIGSGLSCMAAAALGAAPPTTLRPTGDPFARKLEIDDQLAGELLAGNPHFVIVDEGPGLSGSSFGAVADWLESRGVPAEHIAFLPGHAGDLGPQATQAHRARWKSAQRPVVAMDIPMESSLEPLIGPLIRPLTDISGGSWRALIDPSEESWPAVDPMWERRKFLAETEDGFWLVKFAGLGRIGEAKLALAEHLHGAGWGPRVAGLANGWLVSRWHPEAVPTRPTAAELSDYLRFRADLRAPRSGASLSLLVDMVGRNLPELHDWSPDLASLKPRPVCTDNRMAAHEWLRLPSGQLLKSDALDHHAGHDLIGCQDISWDIAGAIVELDLNEAEAVRLTDELGADKQLLDFYVGAYIAFRLGAHRMSADSLSHWTDEQSRHLAAAERLLRRLPAVNRVEHLSHVA